MILSQSINISQSQATEIYKGLKQNEFLKTVVAKQEKELNNAQRLIADQKKSLDKFTELVRLKDEALLNQKEQEKLRVESLNVEIKRLNDLTDVQVKIAKKDGRKKFWNGFAIGGVTVGILGTAAVIYLISN